MVGMFQGMKIGLYLGLDRLDTVNIVIPGSEIPRWFSHQNAGAKVNAHVTHSSHSCNKWIGIAGCAVFSPQYFHPEDVDLLEEIYEYCFVTIGEGIFRYGSTGFLRHEFVQLESDHLWLLYLHPECLGLLDIEECSQTDENGFIHISFDFSFGRSEQFVGKKCGFRMVYERDIEEMREMMAQSSNSSCIVPYEGSSSHAIPIPRYHPYEGVDVDAQHDFDNSMVETESNNDGAGPSGEGSSNDVPHPKRIQICIKDIWETLMEIFFSHCLVFGRMETHK